MTSSFLRPMAFLLGLAIVSIPALAETTDRLITVTGEGRVDAAPDMATIRLGVTETATEAKAAMEATSDAMAGMLARLMEFGIEDRDVQTQNVRLDPIWSRRGNNGDETPKITGFSASNILMVRVRELSTLGSVLDAVLDDGANEFNGLSFGIQDPSALMDQARSDAVKAAVAKATIYAEAAGVTLGSVQSISEAGGARPVPMMMEAAAARSADVVPIAAGEVSLSASVTVRFAIAD